MRIIVGILLLLCSATVIVSQQVAVVALNYTCTSSVSVYEGSPVTICAILTFINGSKVLPISVGVLFNETNGTAVSGINYIGASTYQMFAVGSATMQSVCITIQTIADLIITPSKTFTVNLYPSDSLASIGDRAYGTSVVVTIINIDSSIYTSTATRSIYTSTATRSIYTSTGLFVTPTPTPAAIVYTVVMNTSSITVNESAGSVQICVTVLNGPVSSNIQVNVQFIQGTATAAEYSRSLTKITVNNGRTSGCSASNGITLIQDNLIKGGSGSTYFTVQLQNGTSVLVPYSRSSTNVTILENTVVIFGLWSNPTTLLEGSLPLVSICAQIVSASPLALGIPVTVEIQFTGITATYGADFNPSAVNITFWTGGTFGARNCTNLYIIQDNIVEDNENILISLKSYFYYVGISPTAGSAIFTITDDFDTAAIGFKSSTITVTEGLQPSCQICVQLLTGAIGKRVSAYVTTSALGTAQANVDYIPLDQVEVVFQPGASALLNSTSCINLTIIDDKALENNETVPISLSSSIPLNTLPDRSITTVIIYELIDYIKIGFTGPVSVTEGVDPVATLCVFILDGSLGRSATVQVNLMNFTADPGSDYGDIITTLIFTSGLQTGDSQCFMISIYHSVVVEDTEFFFANLTTSDPAVIIPRGYDSTIITIYDDPEDKITFGMRNILLYCKETDPSIPVCVVLLAGQLATTLRVGIISTDVTAYANIDYKLVNTTITFNSSIVQGQSLCIDVDLIDDNSVEYDDVYFNLTLISIDTVHTVIRIPQASVHIEEDTDDVVSVGFAFTNYSGYEGLLATVCAVILNGTVKRPVSVFASTSQITAIQNVDYQGVQNLEVVFPPGSTTNSTACLNITMYNNTIIQTDRTFAVNVQKIDPSVILLGMTSTTVTIKYNLVDKVVLRMQSPAFNVTEGVNSSLLVCVVMESASGNITRDLSSTLMSINSTAEVIEDYVIPSYSVYFPAWSVPGTQPWCVPVFIIDDMIVGDTDVLSLWLVSNDPAVYVDVNFPVTTITIYEDDHDYIEVQLQYTSLNVTEEDSTAKLCVIMTVGAVERNVTVVLQTNPITAIDGKDYIGGQFNVTFTPGQSATGNKTQCIDLVLLNDYTLENDETLIVTLNLSRQDADVVRIPSAHSVLIITILEQPSKDVIYIGMMQSSDQVVEGEQQYVTLCAVLYQGKLGRNLNVMLQVRNSSLGDSAIAGQDYILQSQTLDFKYDERNNTSSMPCFNVTILDDNNPENKLYITIGLAVALNDQSDVFFVPGRNQTTVEILDDDHGILVGFNDRWLQVTEGVNTSINVCGYVKSPTGIWKTNLSAIIYATNSTAEDHIDYSIPKSMIIFSPWSDSGSMRWCLFINILDDYSVENSEDLILILVSNNPLVEVDANHSLVTINFVEDTDDYINIQMQYTSLIVSEESTTATLCAMIIDGFLGKNVSVLLETHSITAIDGSDYIGGQFILTFISGQSVDGNNLQCINLTILDDNSLEYNETLLITLNSTQQDAGVVMISTIRRKLLLTIIETPSSDIIQIGMKQTYYQVTEGTQQFVTICVAIYQGELGRDLTVILTILNSSTAIPGQNYILQSQTLTFSYNLLNNISSTTCVNITILDDLIPENTLYIIIGLSVPSNESNNAIIAQTKNQSTIAILDGDNGIKVGFNDPLLQVTEGVNSSINVCGFVSNPTRIQGSILTAIITTAPSTAKDLEDYIFPNNTIVLPSSDSGKTHWCLTLIIIDDSILENPEFLVLQLISTSDLVGVDISHETMTVIINEDDHDCIEVQMQYSLQYVSEENSTATLCALMTVGVLGKDVSVILQTHDITALDGKDYIGGQFSLTFTSGQSASGNNLQCMDLVLLNDNILENDETLLVTINSTQQYADFVKISATQRELLLVIIENPKTDSVYIGLVEVYYKVVEGEQQYVTVCAALYQGKLGHDLTVMMIFLNSTLGDTAIPGHDYIMQPLNLTFLYDELNSSGISCAIVTLLDDYIPENELYITIGFSPTSNDFMIIPERNQTTIDILDDDHGIVVGFNDQLLQVTEGVNASIEVCGFLNSSTGIWKSNLSVTVVISNATATDIVDYTIANYAITFSSWTTPESTKWCVNILIIDDNIVEDSEQLTLELVSTNPLVTVQENFSLATIIIAEETADYVVIEMQYSSLSVIESNSTVTVCAVITSGILEKNVTVVMVTHSITAIDGKDFVGGNFTLVFTSGQSAIGNNLQCMDLVLIDDHQFENEERLFIALNSTPVFASVVRISPAKKELLVLINEIPTTDIIQIGMMESFYRVVEGETPFVTICAVLYQGALARDLTVMLTVLNSTVGDTAISGRDYILQSQTLTFVYDESNNISSTPCVNVTILDNYFPENDLYVTLGLLVASNDSSDVFVRPGNNQTTIKLLDDDHAILVGFDEHFVQVTEVLNNSINICGFVSSVTGIWKSNLSAILVVVNTTAKDMEDYIIPSDTITFSSWNTTENTRWCVNILIIDDNIVEDSEQLTLELVSTNPLVTVKENFSLVTVNITEQPTDYVVIEMQYSSLSVIESNSTVQVCAVITSGILGKNVTVVMVTHSITAIDGKDYIGGNFTLVFTSGQSAVGNNLQCIDLVLIDDHEFENEERLSIMLISTPEFASVVRISPIKKELLVLINEIPTTDIIQIGMMKSFYQAVEGETPFVTICAVLYQGALARDLTVMLTVLNSTVGDTAILGRDYILQFKTLTFVYDESNNISSTPCVNVTILDDYFPENDLYVTLGLSVASNDSSDVFVGPGKNQTTVQISDDDHGIIVGFRDPFYEVTEGVNMSINICGFLNSQTGVWKNNLTAIIVAKSDTAKEFEDYFLPNNVITFSSWSSLGGRQWCFPVSIFDDKLLENSEQVMLQIVSTNPLVVVEGNSSTTTINIKEDINDYIEVQMQYPSITVGEVNSVAKLCAVISVGAVGEYVTVVLQTHSITAIDGKDYIGGTFTLIFIPGQSASGNNLICVNLTILNDNLLEYNETFIVTLNSTQQDSNYIRISTRQNITLVTIIEDPQDAIQIGMTKTYVEVVDGEQSYVPICAVILKGELGHDVTVELSILDTSLGTKALPGVDYILKLHTLTFTKGESADANSTHCVNVTLIDDEIPKNEEYFVIGLSPVPVDSAATVIVSDKNETIVAVIDDDHEFTIGMQYRYYTTNEKTGSVTICVIVMDTTTAIRGIINITISTNGTATAGSDYIIPHTISIDSTHAVIGNIFCLNATILDDFTVEYDEYFMVYIAVQNQSRVNVMSNYSTSVVTITEDIMDYVNIGFRQSEYTVYDWINSTVQICIWLSMGVLERNVTITVGTETAHNTTAVPGVNYLPLSKNLTFSPNESTMLCISLTILVDHNSAEKMLTLSISTEDQAVHVTLNRTVIKIQSQTQPPAALTPRTAVIAGTIWMLLLLLCCLMCLFCCLFWRKRQKKRKKVAQEGQRNEVDPIIIHEIKRNKVGIDLLPIHKRQGGASLHEAATEPPIHQRKGCTTFNKDGMELLPIHERKETTVLNKDGMELLPINKRMASSNRVNIKQDRIELLPICETKWNTSSNKTIENKDVIELLPVHETTGDISSSTHLLARNNGTVLQNNVIELFPIHERKGYTPLDNDAINRKGGATLQKDKMELLPIHNWKGDTSSNNDAIKTNGSATLQKDRIELLPIQQRKEDTPLIKGDNSKKRVNLLNQDRIELLPIHEMNKDTSTKNAFDSKECATLQKGTNRLLPIHSTNGDTPQKEDERESKLSTRIDRIKFPPLGEKHHETLPNKSMTERNGDTKLQIDGITAIDDKKGPSLNMDKTVSKEDQSLRNLVLIQEQEIETSRRKETTEGERSFSSKNKGIELHSINKRNLDSPLDKTGIELLSFHHVKGDASSNEDIIDRKGGEGIEPQSTLGMKRQFTRANTKDHHPLNNDTLKREEGVLSKEEGPINKDRSKKKGGFALKKSGTKLLSPHERKSGNLLNTDGIELLPIHQRKGWTSLNDGEINLPSAPQVAPLYEHKIELLPIHTPLGTNEVRRKNVTSFDKGASATIDLIPIHGRKGNGSLHHSGLVTIAAQESKPVQMHKDDNDSFSVFEERTEGKNTHTNAHTLETVPHSMGILRPNADWKEVELIEDNWKYVTEQKGIQPGNKHSINYNSIDKVQPATNKSGHEAICEDSSLQPTIGVDSEFNAAWAKKLTRQEAWF